MNKLIPWILAVLIGLALLFSVKSMLLAILGLLLVGGGLVGGLLSMLDARLQSTRKPEAYIPSSDEIQHLRKKSSQAPGSGT